MGILAQVMELCTQLFQQLIVVGEVAKMTVCACKVFVQRVNAVFRASKTAASFSLAADSKASWPKLRGYQ